MITEITKQKLKEQLEQNFRKELETALFLVRHEQSPTLYPLETIIIEAARRYLDE